MLEALQETTMLFREQWDWAAPQGQGSWEPRVAARRPGRGLTQPVRGLVPQQGEQSRSSDSDQLSWVSRAIQAGL